MTTPAGAATPRVPFTLGRGVAVFALYAVVSFSAMLVSGVDYDRLSESTSNVLGFVVIPIGLGIAATLALTWRWGWWRALFREAEPLTQPRWARVLPALWILTILITLVAAPWDEWSTGLVLLILLGTLMVGFGEEIVFRGYLLVGARSRYSEVGAWFFTSALFGLFHGLNIVTGQAVGTTLQQVGTAFLMGSGLYLIRRISGLLVVGMVIHGLWDFSTFIGAGRGDDAGAGVPSAAYAAPFVLAAMIVTIVLLVKLFRRRSDAPAPA
ncbi:MAG: CPBP family intramembrane metalloprotease [Solirubrobacteraceae bacterium]|jgi:membrane protease YdiL (CAAX protease family)|nr:CPBP family intramembrane metalloprotease [Solirubrobacteraceae bacterium]